MKKILVPFFLVILFFVLCLITPFIFPLFISPILYSFGLDLDISTGGVIIFWILIISFTILLIKKIKYAKK